MDSNRAQSGRGALAEDEQTESVRLAQDAAEDNVRFTIIMPRTLRDDLSTEGKKLRRSASSLCVLLLEKALITAKSSKKNAPYDPLFDD